MNIVIQGRQGCGKTTAAQNIAFAYKKDAVLWVTPNYTKAVLETHLRYCLSFQYIPLFIFEELSASKLSKALAHIKALKADNQNTQIDGVYITQERLNIS